MPERRSPAPRSGGNRAGLIRASTRSNTRPTRKFQERQDSAVTALRRIAFRRLRRQRQVELLYALGPRIIFELIDELDRHYGLGDDLDRRLARYARLDPVILAAVGGDRFPNMPLRMVLCAR
jgi:hypothetical protein